MDLRAGQIELATHGVLDAADEAIQFLIAALLRRHRRSTVEAALSIFSSVVSNGLIFVEAVPELTGR
jgi:hypothetical protein